MSSKSEAPSPVIRYFLPGLVLGAVLGGTLATIVPEFAGAPGSRLDTNQERSPSVDRDADGEFDRDGRGSQEQDLMEQGEQMLDDAGNAIESGVDAADDAVGDAVDEAIDSAGDAIDDAVESVTDGLDGIGGGG